MDRKFDIYKPIAQAISMLLHPHGEVVIHNLISQKIEIIYNNISKRKVGDESLLESVDHYQDIEDVFPVYTKTNWNGKKIKAISIILRDENQKSIGLFCINLDISKWEEMGEYLLEWTQELKSHPQPKSLFKSDWREKINMYVKDYLSRRSLLLETMDREEKRKLVHSLHSEGGFNTKNASSYIADIMGISRATVYNYLRQI